MKWKKRIIILMALIFSVMALGLAGAYDFDPGRDINLRDIYDIKNVVGGDFACINLSGDYRCAWPTEPGGLILHNSLASIQGGTETERYHVNASIYNRIISFVFSWITGDYFDQDLNTTDDVTFRNITANNITADYYFGDGSELTGISAKTYYFNKTSSIYDGNDLGSYTLCHSTCDTAFTGTHLCSINEILDTMVDKNVSAIDEWTGTVWIAGGPPGYLADANDCLGWTSASNQDLGRFWDFDDTTDDGMGWLVNCAQSKSLACCKTW